MPAAGCVITSYSIHYTKLYEAALKIHLPQLLPGGILIVDRDTFTARNLAKAGYAGNPLEEPETGARYRLHALPVTTLTLRNNFV